MRALASLLFAVAVVLVAAAIVGWSFDNSWFNCDRNGLCTNLTTARVANDIYRSAEQNARVAPHIEVPPARFPSAGRSGQVDSGGIKYTGKSCRRSDGSQGREGYRGNQLGCWRF